MKIYLLTALSALIGFSAFSQRIHCNMVEIPLDELTSRSTLIAEGIVLSSESYWDDKKHTIFTKSEIQVLETFKGDDSFDLITVITEGGEVDGISMDFSDKINMRENLHFVLFLEPTPRHWADPTGEGLSPVASLQSVFYVEDDGSMFDVFERFSSIDQVKMVFGLMDPLSPTPGPAPQPNAVVNVSSFFPTTISAGTKSILTINGSGFGATRGNGKVKFSTALNNLRDAALAGDYISWTDTQIQVFVPSRLESSIANSNQSAATGRIEVVNNNGQTFVSSTNLIIPFSILNNFQPGNTTSPSIINMGSGNATQGFDLALSNNIISFAGVPAIKRAMETWICNTQVNWNLTSNAVNVSNTGADGINTILLDTSNPLPLGVIGRGENFVTNNCFGNGFTPVSLQIDMIISANAAGLSYNFSSSNPTSQQIDLETVVLHEFGHLLTLSHVSPAASNNHVMRASVNTGFALRTPHPNDIAGANFALDRSETFNSCGVIGHQRLTDTAPVITISSPDDPADCLISLSPITATVTNAWPTDIIRWYLNGTLTNQTGNVFNGVGIALSADIKAEVVRCGTSYFSNELNFEVYPDLFVYLVESEICIANTGSGLTSTTAANPGYGTTVQFSAPSGVSVTPIGSTSYLISYSSSFVGGSITWSVVTPCGLKAFKRVHLERSPLTMSGSISGAATGVKGLTKTYSVTPVAGATHYVWTTPYMASIVGNSTGSSVQVIFNSSYCTGNITCKAANANGCFSNTLTKAVNGKPLQPSNISFNGVTWPFDMIGTASVVNVNTVSNYQWTVPSFATILNGQGTNSISVQLTSLANNGTVCVTPSNSCGTGPARCKTVNIYNFKDAEGSTSEDMTFTYYPNPANDVLTIAFNREDYEQEQVLTVFSIDGKLLKEIKLVVNTSLSYQMDMSEFPTGNYIISLANNEGIKSGRVIVSR